MRLPRPRVKAPKTPEDPRPVTDDVCTKKKSSVPEHLANARTALELAAKLAPLIPVPFLHSIFESAQVIVNTASVSNFFFFFLVQIRDLWSFKQY